jgi:hypothetical protein
MGQFLQDVQNTLAITTVLPLQKIGIVGQSKLVFVKNIKDWTTLNCEIWGSSGSEY